MTFLHPIHRLASTASRRRRERPLPLVVGIVVLISCLSWSSARAQDSSQSRYFPLDQSLAPGVAGRWSAMAHPAGAQALQPVRLEVPGGQGQFVFFTNPQGTHTALPVGSVAAVRVGSVYRLRISELPDYPGVELYPTVEILDRLHPPRGREIEFAIPLTLTEGEIALALQGRLITKVIYLEQPDRATPFRNTTAARSRTAAPRENSLAFADEMGRPLAIIRLGGRQPDPVAPEPGFFGNGAPVQVLQPLEPAGEDRP